MTSPFIQGKTREKKTPPSPKGTKATVSVVPPSFPRRDAQALYGRYRGRPSAPTARIRWPGFGTAAQERTSSNSFRGTLTAGDVPLWRGRGLAYFLLHGVDNISYSIPPISQIIKRDFFAVILGKGWEASACLAWRTCRKKQIHTQKRLELLNLTQRNAKNA